jgi:hypothetical protein
MISRGGNVPDTLFRANMSCTDVSRRSAVIGAGRPVADFRLLDFMAHQDLLRVYVCPVETSLLLRNFHCLLFALSWKSPQNPPDAALKRVSCQGIERHVWQRKKASSQPISAPGATRDFRRYIVYEVNVSEAFRMSLLLASCFSLPASVIKSIFLKPPA